MQKRKGNYRWFEHVYFTTEHLSWIEFAAWQKINDLCQYNQRFYTLEDILDALDIESGVDEEEWAIRSVLDQFFDEGDDGVFYNEEIANTFVQYKEYLQGKKSRSKQN